MADSYYAQLGKTIDILNDALGDLNNKLNNIKNTNKEVDASFVTSKKSIEEMIKKLEKLRQVRDENGNRILGKDANTIGISFKNLSKHDLKGLDGNDYDVRNLNQVNSFVQSISKEFEKSLVCNKCP